VEPPGRTPPAWVERLEAIALPIFGSRRVVRARAVLDRYNAAGGGLLAAGIAFNTVFALVPLALFAGGVIGFFVTDPEDIATITSILTDWAPPLGGIVDEVVAGLTTSSPTLSLLGLAGMIWGATRLFASLEEGIAAMYSGVPRRNVVVRTVRRLASIAVVAAIVVGAFAATSVASFAAEFLPAGQSVPSVVLNLGLLAVAVVFSAVAIGIIYGLLPPVRPGRAALVVPSLVVGTGLVLLTRILAVVAPRVLGANFVYGTLGAIFVGLGWLGITYSLILVGAAWVRERMIGAEETSPDT
jgi:YihY family inner membrane protein